MLWQRVVTAAVLIVVLVAALLLLHGPWLFAFFGGIALLAAWEWTRISGMTAAAVRLRYLLLVAVLMAGSWFAETEFGAAPLVLAAGCLWWLFTLLLLRDFPASLARDRFGPMARGLAGVLMLVPVPTALVALIDGNGDMWGLALLMGVVWLADIGAYFSGRAWGRNKLAPSVSPGKTREGAIGGALLAFAVCWPAGVWLLPLAGLAALGFALLVLLGIGSAIVGDLVESAFKRSAGVKDSGTLLPGHGGVLDRVDSLLAAAPVFALGLRWLT